MLLIIIFLRLKIKIVRMTFSSYFTSGNKKKADDEFSLPEIRGIPSKKTNQECYLVSIMTAAGTGDFVIGIFTTGSEPQ